MTHEERIAQLEAALADKDRTIAVMSEAIRSATARLEQEGNAARLLLERREAARLKKARQRALSRDSVPAVSPGQSRDNDGTTPSPPSPFPSSFPPSPAPSSPYPLSFPPSSPPLSASQESAGAVPEREELRLTSPTSKRKARTPSRAEELFEALQLTRKQRCDEVGEPWVEEKWSAVFQNTRLKAIVADTDDGKARFEAAWGLYLADDGERVREPAWSLAWFLSPGVRARYETRAAREGAA